MLSQMWDIFIAFTRASNLGFGGGPAVIPLIQVEAVNNYHWMTNEQFADALAITNALPAPIAPKLGAYIGYQLIGWPGVIAALVGTILPTFLAVILLTNILMKYTNSPALKGALKGVRPVVVVLVAQTAFEMGLSSFPNPITWGIAAVAAASLLWLKIHPAILIVCSMAFGLIVF